MIDKHRAVCSVMMRVWCVVGAVRNPSPRTEAAATKMSSSGTDSPSLLREPPLRRVSSFLEGAGPSSPSVSVRLKEPIWQGNAPARLLVCAVQLHTLLERETVGTSSSQVPRRLDEVCSARPAVAELLDSLFADTAVLQPDEQSPMPLLDNTGLSAICPLVGHYLGDPDKVYRNDAVPTVREYLEHVGALNQLLCIANQLRADVLERRHKYTAHKIALLYHAINHSKLAREVLRKRIEEHFEDVKDATESQEQPTLPEDLQYWIVDLCEDIAKLVREPPNSLRTKLVPVAQYLQATR